MRGLVLFILTFLCAGIPYLLYNQSPINAPNLLVTYDYFLGMFLSMFFIANISIQLGYWLAKLFNVQNTDKWAEWASFIFPFAILPFILPPYLDWLTGRELNLRLSDYSPLLINSKICPIKFTIIWNKLVEFFIDLGVNGVISNLIAVITVTGSFLRGFEAFVKFFQSHKKQA